MRSLRPIPLRLLAHTALVRVPDGLGGFKDPVAIGNVACQAEESFVDDDHRCSAAAATVYIDAVNSRGAFEVPAGSRIEIGGTDYGVATCKRCEDLNGRIHHWKLKVV